MIQVGISIDLAQLERDIHNVDPTSKLVRRSKASMKAHNEVLANRGRASLYGTSKGLAARLWRISKLVFSLSDLTLRYLVTWDFEARYQ